MSVIKEWKEAHPRMGWKLVRDETEPLLARIAELETSHKRWGEAFDNENLRARKAEAELAEYKSAVKAHLASHHHGGYNSHTALTALAERLPKS